MLVVWRSDRQNWIMRKMAGIGGKVGKCHEMLNSDGGSSSEGSSRGITPAGHFDTGSSSTDPEVESDVMAADGYILGTPANLGSMSGALKHCFDTVYYPCLEETIGRPHGIYVHGNNDVDGALRDIARITTGLRWRLAQPPVAVIDAPSSIDLEQCWELGAAIAAGLMAD